jgi:SulP family sulfate permease
MYTPKLFTEIRTYSRAKAVADLFAGLTVGIVALPLAMAFAIASGLPPERGLFTAIVAGLLVSTFGGSKIQIGGPTGAFVILVSSVLGRFGYEGLAVCTVLAGILLILFGVFRLGGLIRFIPFPVTTGFTTGIALVIFSTQIRDLLGLRVATVPAEFIEKWHLYITRLHTLNPQAAGVGIGTILVIVVAKWVWPRLPAMLVGMVAATLVSVLFQLDVETIGSRFGELPRTLPSPAMPKVPWTELTTLVKPAFTIALLAAIESLLSATVADGMIGGRHRPNAELIGQGIANIGSIVFGGIPATGAIARTATNAKSGGRTPVAGIVHAIVLALLLLLLAPLAKLIPLAALAGILVVVSYNMSERHHFVSILRGPKSDAFVLLLTFALTVLVDLTLAVQVGVMLAALLFIRRMAEISNVGMITSTVRGDEDAREEPGALQLREVPPGVEVFEVCGPFFFGMIDTFKNAMRTLERPPAVLIIRIRSVLAIDATAIHVLRDLHAQCRRDHTLLVFSGVHTQPYLALDRCGFMDEVGRENFLGCIDDSLVRAREYLGLGTD